MHSRGRGAEQEGLRRWRSGRGGLGKPGGVRGGGSGWLWGYGGRLGARPPVTERGEPERPAAPAARR